jgi:type IV pilus assembly protein PilB
MGDRLSTQVPIGQRLVRQGSIEVWQLQSALVNQKRWGGRLGEALVRMGFVSEPVVLAEVARQLGVPYVELRTREVLTAVVRMIPERIIRSRKVFPVALTSQPGRGHLQVATVEPQNLALLDDLAFATGTRVQLVLASERDIEIAIERHLGPGARSQGEVEVPGDDPKRPMQVVPFGDRLH